MVALAVTTRKPFVPNYDRWEPPDWLFPLLDQARLTRDKVEIVWAVYAHDHKGQGPWASEIADVLGIAKQNVERRMTELIAEGRAAKRHGKFILIKSNYTHPAIVDFLDGD